MTERISILDKGYVRLVDTMGSDISVANAARVSFDKESKEFGKRDEKLINFLVREGHTSPFRHATLSFEIYAPLMVCRQWMKYVVGSSHVEDGLAHNESSRRYVTEIPEFYVPAAEEWRTAPENMKQGSAEPLPAYSPDELWPDFGDYWTALLEDHCKESEELYESAMEAGICAEQARLFLPAYGLYVRWRWTTSLAALMHFLNERLAHDAQFEISEYAKAVKSLAETKFPVSIGTLNG